MNKYIPGRFRRFSSKPGKPGAVVSASPGAIGGFGTNHRLRQSLVFLNVPTMQQPEAYVSGADKLFDANGEIVNDGTRTFLQSFMQAFATWRIPNHNVQRVSPDGSKSGSMVLLLML